MSGLMKCLPHFENLYEVFLGSEYIRLSCLPFRAEHCLHRLSPYVSLFYPCLSPVALDSNEPLRVPSPFS